MFIKNRQKKKTKPLQLYEMNFSNKINVLVTSNECIFIGFQFEILSKLTIESK